MMMMMTLVVVIAMPMMLTQSTVTINEMIAAMTTSSMPSPMTYQLAPTRKTQPHPSAETNSPHAGTRDSETPTLLPSSPALFAVTPGNTSHASCDRMNSLRHAYSMDEFPAVPPHTPVFPRFFLPTIAGTKKRSFPRESHSRTRHASSRPPWEDDSNGRKSRENGRIGPFHSRGKSNSKTPISAGKRRLAWREDPERAFHQSRPMIPSPSEMRPRGKGDSEVSSPLTDWVFRGTREYRVGEGIVFFGLPAGDS